MSIPSNLDNNHNHAVLNYLADKSAHDGAGEALLDAVKPLGDVQIFSPNFQQYRYVAVSTKRIIFGIAVGMNTIAFRLNEPLRSRGLATGGAAFPECGPAWIAFVPFRDDWPEIDLKFWARKAYVYARETR